MDYINDSGLRDFEGTKPNQSEIEFCENWIKTFVTERKSINTKRGSYGLKHAVENWCDEYVSNGAFIQAAVNLGYQYKREGPNACFNMSFPRRRTALAYEAFEKKGGFAKVHTKLSDDDK